MEATTLSQKRIFLGKHGNMRHLCHHGGCLQVAPHANFADFGGIRQSPEAQRNSTTAHNRQKTHYFAVASRRIVPLNEKWGKSRFFGGFVIGQGDAPWAAACPATAAVPNIAPVPMKSLRVIVCLPWVPESRTIHTLFSRPLYCMIPPKICTKLFKRVPRSDKSMAQRFYALVELRGIVR